ncbi:hypothetical protein ACNJYD_08780 [Bradyrhizobium sp. DASA03005]|uniref:hypothetical protein n=1 Tax=Bradyrhizobium sp. SPXBL-02 TaxID=3395912 RepID=UPI003F71F872
MSYASSILSYGAIGLGFLLAWLAYRLLLKEQGMVKPRSSILSSIYMFEGFAIVLVIIGAILEYTNNVAKAGAFTTSSGNAATSTQYASIAASQSRAIKDAASNVEKILQDLAAQNKLAVEDSCPGGSNGVPSNHAGEITSLNTKISADVAAIKGTLGSVADFKSPQAGP